MFFFHHSGIYGKSGVLGRKKTAARIRVTPMRINLQRIFFFIQPPKAINNPAAETTGRP
jgi:hypothetical protein